MRKTIASRVGTRLAWAGLAATASLMLVQLARQAARATLNNDECFHAHVARWIAAHGAVPERIPELYGGLFYSYPPLLHILGAGWVTLFGPASLPLMSVVLYGALLGALALVPVPGLPPTPRRWALWLVIANVALATYAVQFYAEILTCLMGALVALLVLRLAATRRVRDGLLLGAASGLAMLAKNTALLVPALLVAFVMAEAVARRRDGVRAGLWALGLALALAAPMLLRNQMLFGSAIYPGLARDVDPWLYQLNHGRFGRDLPIYLASVGRTLGAWVLGWGAVGGVVALATRRRDAVAGLLVCALLGIAVSPLSPLHEARHVMPLVAVIALAGAIILHHALRARALASSALEYGLAAIALIAVLTLGDRRAPYDVPPRLAEAYAAIAERVPAGRTVLSLWTYETFYHAGRPATWPIPWGQGTRSPAALFRERDPGRFLAELDRLGIEWMLVPRAPDAGDFNGANYPESFMSCVMTLAQRGALRVAWGTPALVLVERVRRAPHGLSDGPAAR